MFAARGIAVSLSMFLIIYGMVSLAVVSGWRRAWVYARRLSVRRAANILFALRMLPLITATLITATLTVPSFLLLEPRTIEEPLGGGLLLLAASGLVLGLVGTVNAGRAFCAASRAVARWTCGARPIEPRNSVPVLTVAPVCPAMSLTGIVRPRILVSRAAERQLTRDELQAALKHELAHVRRADNLKKLLLRFVAFPGMRGLEAAWLESIELAADATTVVTTRDALDLASALIKLSRLVPEGAAAGLTVALVDRPVSSVYARVERLLAWHEELAVRPSKPSRRHGLSLSWMASFAALAMFALAYNELLVELHRATEWLVR